jgi:hypothetical protein
MSAKELIGASEVTSAQSHFHTPSHPHSPWGGSGVVRILVASAGSSPFQNGLQASSTGFNLHHRTRGRPLAP